MINRTQHCCKLGNRKDTLGKYLAGRCHSIDQDNLDSTFKDKDMIHSSKKDIMNPICTKHIQMDKEELLESDYHKILQKEYT